MMEKEFQMSMMRELTFSLGIQVKETKQVTFVHQAKYTKDLMKKLNMAELKPVSTLLSTATSLDPDKNGEATDQREYGSMLVSLLYLTVTWSDIQFIVCQCLVNLQVSQTHSRVWDLVFCFFLAGSCCFFDADFVGCGIDRRALLILVIFLDLHPFAGLLKNNLQLHNPPQRLSM
jgi:hypothetical protein